MSMKLQFVKCGFETAATVETTVQSSLFVVIKFTEGDFLPPEVTEQKPAYTDLNDNII